ncbi:hypothetical protein LX36DRAFT_151147 [Colletotrichum falcatum]|nr:hypothetical protein LX36DRAFT_151147 [Colletotrichum falcatum]
MCFCFRNTGHLNKNSFLGVRGGKKLDQKHSNRPCVHSVFFLLSLSLSLSTFPFPLQESVKIPVPRSGNRAVEAWLYETEGQGPRDVDACVIHVRIWKIPQTDAFSVVLIQSNQIKYIMNHTHTQTHIRNPLS